MKKIISIILISTLFLFMLSACGKPDKPNVIDFMNDNEETISEYVGEEVVLYGYFALNAMTDNKAYLSSLPYTAIMNDQDEYDKTTYIPITIENTGVMPVFFKETPEYTTAPVKITGVLKKVSTYDDVAYVSYTYAITEAVCTNIESYSLGAGFKEFVTFTKKGYPDVVYQNLLNLELFAYGYTEEFPEEENYKDVISDFENKKLSTLEEAYLNHLEATHLLYETYGEKYSKKEKIDNKILLEETSKIVEEYIDTISKFAAFNIIKDDGNGFDKLEPVFALVEEGDLPTGITAVTEPTEK
jgi:hypothetical protein